MIALVLAASDALASPALAGLPSDPRVALVLAGMVALALGRRRARPR